MKRKVGVLSAAYVLAAVSLFSGTGFPVKAESVSKTYLIAFQDGVPVGYEKTMTEAGGTEVFALPELGVVQVQSSDAAFLSRLQKVKGIQAAGIEMVHTLEGPEPTAADGLPVTDIPQDAPSFWEYQWDIRKVTGDGESYKLEAGGFDLPDGTVDHKAVVGIIDSGVDTGHPDLKANFLGGLNLVPAGTLPDETGSPSDVRDRTGHGTHVTGAISANGKVKGVGPKLGFRAYRVFPAVGGAPTSRIATAIMKAADDGVDVINLSVGSFESAARYSYYGYSYNDVADILLYKRALSYALKKGVTVVTSAGNEGLDLNDKNQVTDYMNLKYGLYGIEYKGSLREVPGMLSGVINVAASVKWSADRTAFYSNYGSGAIDVAAPGGDYGPVYAESRERFKEDYRYNVLSTYPTYLRPYRTSNLNGYALMQGTSMAAPKVAGMAAVIKAAHPEYSPAQIAALIRQSALDLGKPGHDEYFGAGEANLYQALTR